jgi:hypothetical protein
MAHGVHGKPRGGVESKDNLVKSWGKGEETMKRTLVFSSVLALVAYGFAVRQANGQQPDATGNQPAQAAQPGDQPADSALDGERQMRAQSSARRGAGDADNRWRYRYHNGRWWYWQGDRGTGRWLYYNNNRWYDRELGRFYEPRRYMGYRGYDPYDRRFDGPYYFDRDGRRYWRDGDGRYQRDGYWNDRFWNDGYRSRYRSYWNDYGARRGATIGGAIGEAIGGPEGGSIGAGIGAEIGRDRD